MHFERINKKKRWQDNKRAGKFYEETQKNYIDQKGSFQWLQNGELKYDEETFDARIGLVLTQFHL